MSEKITAYKGKIKHRGLYPFKDVYEFLYDYLMDEDYDVYEKFYVEKRVGDAKEVDISWEANKRISDYFTVRITAFWIVLDMKSVEIEKEGQKIKTDSGVLEINIQGLLVKDPNDIWKNSPWKTLRKIYDKFIIKKRIEYYKEFAKEEAEEFIGYIRSLLAFETKHETRKETLYI